MEETREGLSRNGLFARWLMVLVIALVALVLGIIGLNQYLSHQKAPVAYGRGWLDSADALSYLVPAGANALTARAGRSAARPRTTVGGVFRGLAEGGRVLRAEPVVRALLPVTVIFLAANAALSAMLIPLGVRRLGGTEHIGLLFSALGAGFLLAGPVLRAVLDRLQPRGPRPDQCRLAHRRGRAEPPGRAADGHGRAGAAAGPAGDVTLSATAERVGVRERWP